MLKSRNAEVFVACAKKTDLQGGNERHRRPTRLDSRILCAAIVFVALIGMWEIAVETDEAKHLCLRFHAEEAQVLRGGGRGISAAELWEVRRLDTQQSLCFQPPVDDTVIWFRYTIYSFRWCDQLSLTYSAPLKIHHVTEMLRSSRSSTMTIRRIRPLPRSRMRTANRTTWNTSVVSWVEIDGEIVKDASYPSLPNTCWEGVLAPQKVFGS